MIIELFRLFISSWLSFGSLVCEELVNFSLVVVFMSRKLFIALPCNHGNVPISSWFWWLVSSLFLSSSVLLEVCKHYWFFWRSSFLFYWFVYCFPLITSSLLALVLFCSSLSSLLRQELRILTWELSPVWCKHSGL